MGLDRGMNDVASSLMTTFEYVGWLVLADPEGNEFCLEGAGTG